MLIRLPAGAFPGITRTLAALNFKCPVQKRIPSIKNKEGIWHLE